MNRGEPYLPGYDVEWDIDAREWLARSPAGDELRGKDQTALTLARCRLVMKMANDLSAIIQAAPSYGYSPPPR